MRSHRDWLGLVYGVGLDPDRPADEPGRTGITLRQSPELTTYVPGVEQQVRVTVSPADPALDWRLNLVRSRDGDASPGPEVWWRVDPGTWRRLEGARECVAEGRGRSRVDVQIRVVAARGATDPHLEFTAEPGRSAADDPGPG